jgi:hypothetical protein
LGRESDSNPKSKFGQGINNIILKVGWIAQEVVPVDPKKAPKRAFEKEKLF